MAAPINETQATKHKYKSKDSKGYKYNFSNPVVGTYRGVTIRKYNEVKIRVSCHEFRQFIDAKLDHRLPTREAIQHMKLLCNPCNQDGGLHIAKVFM